VVGGAGQFIPEQPRKFYESLAQGLITYAEAQFRLDRLQEDGRTFRVHLQQVERQRGKPLPELHPEPPPRSVVYIWEWFIDLSLSRGGDLMTSAVPYSEISAWASLTGQRPTAWEVSILRRIDIAYLKARRDD
jgi:hypothetical protein